MNLYVVASLSLRLPFSPDQRGAMSSGHQLPQDKGVAAGWKPRVAVPGVSGAAPGPSALPAIAGCDLEVEFRPFPLGAALIASPEFHRVTNSNLTNPSERPV